MTSIPDRWKPFYGEAKNVRRPDPSTVKEYLETAARAILAVPILIEEIGKLEWKIAGHVEHLKRVILELEEKRQQLAVVKMDPQGVWMWQGDGADHPESLSCPVVMSADMLREMLGERDPKKNETPEASVAPKWFPCSMCGKPYSNHDPSLWHVDPPSCGRCRRLWKPIIQAKSLLEELEIKVGGMSPEIDEWMTSRLGGGLEVLCKHGEKLFDGSPDSEREIEDQFDRITEYIDDVRACAAELANLLKVGEDEKMLVLRIRVLLSQALDQRRSTKR